MHNCDDNFMTAPIRHFRSLLDCTPVELNYLIERGIHLKALRNQGKVHEPLVGKVMTMIFEKSSTRTRISFEAGMAQLGGHAIFISPRDSQLSRGEPLEDTAKVVSSMTDIVMIRTFGQDIVERFAAHSRVPVINGLTNLHHPCQVLADVMTFVEQRGSIAGKTVLWLGDGYNMCHSFMHAAKQFGFHLRVCTPTGYEPNPDTQAECKGSFSLHSDPLSAAEGVDLVVTDVWTSMGCEAEAAERYARFTPYQVNSSVMAQAKPEALFMHCLPAHRGEEVSANVIDGAQSVVWDEAENRLHAQKALMEFLLLGQQA
jgi:ornithine carbamoyltransferase